MNKLVLFGVCFCTCIGLTEACGFGALCGALSGGLSGGCGGGGGGCGAAPPLPPLPSLCGGGGGGAPTIVQCPGASLQNSCSGGGGGGGCGGGGGGGGCGRCVTRRRIFHKRHVRDAVHLITEFVNSTEDHPVCNNGELHKLIEENLSEDAEKTKDAIHEAVTKKMHGINFAVICSPHPFHFTSDNHMYCLHGNKTMTCYVFQSN